eukprot:gene15685-17267_t
MAANILQKLLFVKSWLAVTYENTSLVIQYTSFLIPPNFRIWTLFTGGLIERNLIFVLVDIAVLLLCGKQLEPLWGALELLKFLAILDVFSTLCTTLMCLFAYLSLQSTIVWFATFSGMTAIIGGITVAFKQIMPDQKVDLRITEVRVETIPSILITISCVFATVGILPMTHPLMLFNGIIIGWVYLRFYQPRGKGIKGDMNEHFLLATFFPAPMRPPVNRISQLIFNILLKIGLCKAPVRTYDVGAPSSITISLPGSSPSDAERRRRKALRALNERLKKEQETLPEKTEESWPSIDDENALKETEENEEESKSDVKSESSDNVVESVDDNEVQA